MLLRSAPGRATFVSGRYLETFPTGAWDAGDRSYARPLRPDSPSLFRDGTTR
jgi:hypothetical protein